MIAGAIIILAGLALAAFCITAPGPVLVGAGPVLAVLAVYYGRHVFLLNLRRRRIARRRAARGGFLHER